MLICKILVFELYLKCYMHNTKEPSFKSRCWSRIVVDCVFLRRFIKSVLIWYKFVLSWLYKFGNVQNYVQVLFEAKIFFYRSRSLDNQATKTYKQQVSTMVKPSNLSVRREINAHLQLIRSGLVLVKGY